MQGKRLVLKARKDLDRVLNYQAPIEDEPDPVLKACFIMTTFESDVSNTQGKANVRSDPETHAGGTLNTSRRDLLRALKIAMNEVEQEEAATTMKEESSPKPRRPVRRKLPVYQENVPQPQEAPRQPRVVIHRPPPPPQLCSAPPRIRAVPATTAAPHALHGAFQTSDLTSLVTSIALQQPHFPAQTPPAARPPDPAPAAAPPQPDPAQVAAMAAELQGHISNFMQCFTGYPLGIVPLAAPGQVAALPPVAPLVLAPVPPSNAAAMAQELQQHIARFMEAQSRYMYPIRAPEMPFLPPFLQYWMARGTDINNSHAKALDAANGCPAASANTTAITTERLEENATSVGRAFGKNLSVNDADDKGASQDINDANQGRRLSQRKIKPPVRNTNEAFEFKENKFRMASVPKNQTKLNYSTRSKAQPSSQEVKRGIASTLAAVPTTTTAATTAPATVKSKSAPAAAPLPPAQNTLQIFSNNESTAPNGEPLENIANESLEAQIKRKTITTVNSEYYAEMPEDIQIMEKQVLDFSNAYHPAGPSYFTPEIKALKGAAMYSAQLAVIEKRLAWVVEEMKKDGIMYGWKKGEEPAPGSYEFYRGIAMKYLRDRLRSRCRVEATKRDKS